MTLVPGDTLREVQMVIFYYTSLERQRGVVDTALHQAEEFLDSMVRQRVFRERKSLVSHLNSTSL